MNSYFTRLRYSTMLSSVMAFCALFLGSQTAFAQLEGPPFCPSAKIYSYNWASGVRSDGNVGANKLTPGVMAPSPNGPGTLATALANTNFLGATAAGISFYDPTDKVTEKYNHYTIDGLAVLQAVNGSPNDGINKPVKGVRAGGLGYSILGTTPHAGEPIRSCDNAANFMGIVGGNVAILKDANGYLSLYNYTNGLYLSNYLWNQYTNGTLGGTAPTPGAFTDISAAYIYNVLPTGKVEYYTTGGGVYITNLNLFPAAPAGQFKPLGVLAGPLDGTNLYDAMKGGIRSTFTTALGASAVFLGISDGLYATFFVNGKVEYYYLPTETYFGLSGPSALTGGGPKAGSLTAATFTSCDYQGLGGGGDVFFSFLNDKNELFYYDYLTGTNFGQFSFGCFSTWDGPQAGKPIARPYLDATGKLVNDPTFIEAAGAGNVYIDADGTLSWYFDTGLLFADYCWDTFTGGPFAGQKITDVRSKIIGSESGVLFLITPSGQVVSYDMLTGTVPVVYPFTTFTGGGPLDGKPVVDGVGDLAKGVTFLGVDGVNLVFAACEEDITVTKAIASIMPNPADGTAMVTYEMTVENTGGVDLTNIKLEDNLLALLGLCLNSVAPTTITSSTATTTPTINSGFNGGTDIKIFDGTSGLLKKGEKVTVRAVVTISLACGLPVNIALAKGTGSAEVVKISVAPPAAILAANAAEARAKALASGLSVAQADALAAAIIAGCPLTTGTVTATSMICSYETAALTVPAAIATGTWSGGAGTFLPSASTPNAVYKPAQSEYDKPAGSPAITLTWTPTTVPACSFYNTVINVQVKGIPASVACYGSLNISLPSPSCSMVITPEMILRNEANACYGNYRVILEVDGVVIPNATITRAHIGRQIKVSVVIDPPAGSPSASTGNTCWGYINVEDKSAPVVTPPAGTIVACSDANAALLLPGAPASGFPYRGATASAGTGMAYPTVTDCSGILEVYYSDVVSAVGCDGSKTVTRTWRAKDIHGMVGTAAVQVIVVNRPGVIVPAAYSASVTVNCTDAVPAAIAAGSIGCGVSISQLGQDIRINLCGNTYKLVRVYQWVDACPAGVPGMLMGTVSQTITVRDVTTPKLTVSGTSYPLVAGPTFTNCGNANNVSGTSKVNAAEVSTEVGNAGTLASPVAASAGVLALTAWADAAMCGAGRFSLNVGSTDNCTNGSVTTNDSRYQVVNGVIQGTVMGNTTFNIIATDACGNTSTVAVTVNVVDNISPTAICDGVTATLNNYKQAVITGASFNNASNDNCGITRILVAKAVGTALPTDWCTSVTYECAELGATGLKVWIRYMDAAGNFTDCCVPVSIVDKGTLTCTDRGTISRICTDQSLTNLDGLFTQPAFFYDGCSTPAIVATTNASAIACGAGTIVRTWTFTITNSLGTQTATCTQGINITATGGFRVTILPDTTATCAAAYNLEANRQQVIRNLQLLYATPSNNAMVRVADASTATGTRVTAALISNPSSWVRAAWGANASQTATTLSGGALSPIVPVSGVGSYSGAGFISHVVTAPFLAASPFPNPTYSGPYSSTANGVSAVGGFALSQPINASQAMIAGYPSCAAPVVEASDWVYSNTEFCKVYVQTFIIKDACLFSNDVGTTNLGAPISNTGVFRTPGTGALTDTLYSPTFSGVWQSVPGTDGRQVIRFTRLFRVNDRTAPTSTAPADLAICDGDANDRDADNCEFGFSRTISGTDACGTVATGSALAFTWSIANASSATILTGTGTTVGMNNLAFGSYKVTYRVADLCGNISGEYTFNVSGADCKAPEILVHDKIVSLAGQTGVPASGMARLFYADIKNRITDNCAGDLTNSGKLVIERGGATPQPLAPVTTSLTTLTDGVMFGCADLGNQSVRVWAVDGSGNWNFAVSTITVQDNDGICAARPVIAGTIGTEAGSLVKDVVVSANANGIVAGSATTPAAGTYQVTGLTAGTNYQVRAVKTLDNDKKNGVTTLDIALISKHLLAEAELNSAYKIIAADVDKNGEVDATDMLHIRRFILSITANLPAGSAWRFVSKDYTFRNATNPLGEDFPEVVNLANVPVGTTTANFTAVKLADVNNSYDVTTVRGSRVLAFSTEDRAITAGNEYTVAIATENMTAAAFQGTFSFDGAKVKAVKAGSLNNVTDNNFNMTANAVAASWNGKSEASATVANITFIATKSGKLSEMLTVNSALTMAEGYDAAGNAMNVTLKFSNGKVAGGEFALYQNTPNPVASSTKIGFNLPKDGQAKLTIYTAEGKVLSVTNNNYKAGYNEVTINKSDLNASGMLYYRLDTQDNSSTRKMIVIE